jgi:D-sedoheptulose 7-phosphate isomerase
MQKHLAQSFADSVDLLHRFTTDRENLSNVTAAVDLIAQTFRAGNKVLIAGNGGSMCDAMHFAEEFTGRYRKDRRPLPVIAISDPTHISCVANDFGVDQIFSRGVEAYGAPGDVFVGLSTSGNSANIIAACASARKKKLKTVLFLGKDGGRLKKSGDIRFIVPGVTSDRVQEVHMTLLHVIIEGVERKMFPAHYAPA